MITSSEHPEEHEVHPKQEFPRVSSSDLRIDRYITNEEALQTYHNDLRTRGIEKIALDLEGDQGTIHYNYSISIFQCFDGQEIVIIDVVTMGNNYTLTQFLTDPAIIKIMFSCANDAFITQNVLGCTISPVRDIAVAQKLLNEPISLSGYLTIDQKIKNAFQRANWLKRPLSNELLAYAVNDVMHLISIEETLRSRLDTPNQINTYIDGSNSLVTKNYRINQLHHYKAKFPGYPRLSPLRKRTAALIWIVRELIGKHFDCPVGYILSKKAMASIMRTPESLAESLEHELNRHRSERKKISVELVHRYIQKANDILEHNKN